MEIIKQPAPTGTLTWQPINVGIEPTAAEIERTLALIAWRNPTGRVFVTFQQVGGWNVAFEVVKSHQDAQERS